MPDAASALVGVTAVDWTLVAQPILSLVVAWHPGSPLGAVIARQLFAQYRSAPFERVAGASGISVTYRSSAAEGTSVPADVDFAMAATTAVVLLIDDAWCADPAWVAWARELESQCERLGLRTRLFPVWLVREGDGRNLKTNAVRWDTWDATDASTQGQRLYLTLTHQLCRMQRVALAAQERAIDDEAELQQYLAPVKVFLSHSKHDVGNEGQAIAEAIRARVHAISDLGTFFDLVSIPPGLPFDRVIQHFARISAMVAIHTDSYSSREWCRREILEAKRAQVPLVVASAIQEMDERSFPYLGNVPVVRLRPMDESRLDLVIGRLLDEVLRELLWRYRVASVAGAASADTVFLPRSPELIALAGRTKQGQSMTVVYPDPPLGAEEERVFFDIAPAVELRSMMEWLANARHAAPSPARP